METKAEKITVLLNIIFHKAERIKKLKLECGQQATKGCGLNERIKTLETENKKLIEGQQAKLEAGS